MGPVPSAILAPQALMDGAAERAWVWAPPILIGLQLLLVCGLGRSIVNEDWDGVKAVGNALLVAGNARTGSGFDGKRPPVGWLVAAPFLSRAYRSGGPQAALRTCRTLMPCILAVLLLVCHRLYLRLFSGFAASVAVLLMACNPILLQFAPFAAFDIFSALALLPFLAAGYRCLRTPGWSNYALLAGAYLLAFLSKYHLGIMILVPLSFLLLEPGPAVPLARLRRFLLSPIWLLPGLCWIASGGVLGALLFWISGGDGQSWSRGRHELWENLSFNVLSAKASHWYLYIDALWRQLDFGLTALMLCGLGVWLAGKRSASFYLALALIVPFLALSFGIANKEARYAIPLLPLVYAAIAQGLEYVLERLPQGPRSRLLLLAACLVVVPWSESLAAARYLLNEPSVHTQVPWELARLVETETPASGCLSWIEGDVLFPIKTPLYRYEWSLIMGAPTFGFFVHRRVEEVKEAGGGKSSCEAALTLLPRVGPRGERWRGGPAARVYRVSSGPSGPSWEVFPDRVRSVR